MNKIVLIGCGKIGMGYAYSLINNNYYVDELVLIDIDNEKAQTSALDLTFCLAYDKKKINIHAGNYNECKDANIVVIAAGANQNIGETKLDLVYKNSTLFKQIIDQVLANEFNGIFLVATYPSEILTTFTIKYSKFSPEKVIGLGTSINTAQLKSYLKSIFEISMDNIDVYVMGECGEYQFIPWSLASYGLYNMEQSCSNGTLEKVEENVKEFGEKTANNNNDYSFFTGMTTANITNAILNDEKIVLTVCSYDDVNDICVSSPTKIGAGGVIERIGYNLTPEDGEKMKKAIDSIKLGVDSITTE